MNKQDQMTMQEAERKMESLREVFQVVRLVDGKMLMDREKRINAGDLSETCQCYSFWKKDKECENCSSLLALKEQTQKIKFEFLDLQVFQMISRYVEIDGRPYVMEMIQNLDESIQIDQEGYDKLISKLSGYNEKLYIEDIPVIMISSEDSDSYIRRAYEMGVSDYISCPFDAKIVYQRVLNMIKLYAKQRRLIRLVTRQIYEKERNNRMLIGILSQIVEFRNGESGLHVIHINLITQLLLEQLVKKTGKYQLSWEDRLLIATASALHDIGKIGIDEKILNKPGKLTKEEFEIMKTHTLIGAQMLDNLDMYRNEKLLNLAYEICRWHHERYDGKGYPDGLVGEEIPISAQVVSLADVYDALVSERVYKKAFSHEKALEMIQNGECGTFNPLLLQCMTEAQDKLKTMMEVAEKNKKE